MGLRVSFGRPAYLVAVRLDFYCQVVDKPLAEIFITTQLMTIPSGLTKLDRDAAVAAGNPSNEPKAATGVLAMHQGQGTVQQIVALSEMSQARLGVQKGSGRCVEEVPCVN